MTEGKRNFRAAPLRPAQGRKMGAQIAAGLGKARQMQAHTRQLHRVIPNVVDMLMSEQKPSFSAASGPQKRALCGRPALRVARSALASREALAPALHALAEQ